MFTCFPKTKTYFAHLDIGPGSAHLRSHGKKIILAIAEGAKNISSLTTTLAPLSALHAYQLRIHPTNFKVPRHKALTSFVSYSWQKYVFLFAREACPFSQVTPFLLSVPWICTCLIRKCLMHKSAYTPHRS